MGKQAQLDWKESIPFILSSGETIDVNVFVILLSYSRFRVYWTYVNTLDTKS